MLCIFVCRQCCYAKAMRHLLLLAALTGCAGGPPSETHPKQGSTTGPTTTASGPITTKAATAAPEVVAAVAKQGPELQKLDGVVGVAVEQREGKTVMSIYVCSAEVIPTLPRDLLQVPFIVMVDPMACQ